MINSEYKAHNLFLLMVNLSHFTSKAKLVTFFLSAIKEIWPEPEIAFVKKHPSDQETYFEVKSGTHVFGYFIIKSGLKIPSEDSDLLSNAIVLLSLAMTKADKDWLVEKEKRKLEKLVESQVKVIRESEEKFRNVFENSIVSKSITTVDGKMMVNNAFCSLLGYTRDELYKLTWRQITFPEDTERDQKIVNSILESKRSSARWEKRYLSKSGKVILADISTALQRDQEGRPLYFITSVNDITELRKAEEEIRSLNEILEQRIRERTAQLEESNKELEAFSYSVSHDLRAPLRHISGYVELLKLNCYDRLTDKGKHYLDSISDSTGQMGKLIDDLLQFARSNQAELNIAHFDMNPVLEEAVKSVKPEAAGRIIKWNITPLPFVYGDSSLLLMVWKNLLSNAVKFTRTRELSVIEIGFNQTNQEYEFFVKDNGVGFDMKYSHNLFGVFQRLHPADQFEGNGIGLANVGRIIAKHGGKAWAEASPDKGATFYFSLFKKYDQNHRKDLEEK